MRADRTAAQSSGRRTPGPPEAPGPPDAVPAGDGASAGIPGSIQDEIIRQSVDAIIITDVRRAVRVWNPAAERLYGIPARRAIGRRMSTIVDASDTAGRPIDSLVALADLQARGSWRRRVVHRPRIGPLAHQEVVVDSIVTMLLGPDGAPVGALGVNRDITSSARLEAELAALGSLVVAADRARTSGEVAQAALEILCRATGAEAGLVTATDDGYEAAAHLGVRQETIDVIVNYGQLGGPLAEALRAPDAYVSADVSTAPLREDVRAAVAADGIEHLIVVGLRLSGTLTGILALGWRQRTPREPSRAILHQAAALVASSMENARLLAAVERGLTEERLLTRRMRALVELTRLPETAAAGGSGGDRLMAEIGAVIDADASILARLDGDRLALSAVDRIDWAVAEPFVNRPLARMPAAAELLAGAPALLFSLGETPTSPEGTAASAASGFRSVAAFAIRDGDRLSGVLFSIFRRPLEELAIDERTLESIGRVLDISFANRRLREVVSAGERRYRDLFEGSPDALLVQSTDGIVVDANQAAIRLYGGELVGRPMADLVAEEQTRPIGEAGDPSGFTQNTGLGRRLDGTTFPEEIDLRPIEIDGDQRLLAIVRDLTERTRMQAELVQAQKMDAIGLLVSGVAHELNNPLASIVGFSHLLRTDPNLPPDLRRQADLLVQEANRTRVIVQNLLDFARQRPPERVETELRPLIDSVLGLQSYVLARNHLAVEVDLPPDLPPLSIDRSQIQQVLINLTVNAAQAIHALDRPGAIRIRARPSRDERGPTVRIEVADDGPGVAPGIVDRLFMPFVTTKEPGAGTGLGLSVSFGIIAGHGGTLRHEPNPGGGAMFIIELPVARDGQGSAEPATADPTSPADGSWSGAASSNGTASSPGEPPSAIAANGGAGLVTPPAGTGPAAPGSPSAVRPLRVLVLDDEPAIREFLGRVLVRNGHEPILASTGASALEIVRTDPPDVILCDHRMAGMSGTEFHAAVIAIAPALAKRFAFMSGDVLNPELRDFAAAGGMHLLAKPFDIAAVGAIVSALVAADPD